MYVSNTTDKSDGVLCFKDNNYTLDTIPYVFNTTCAVHGQYVIYFNEYKTGDRYANFTNDTRYAFNELCELEVYGKRLYFIIPTFLLSYQSNYVILKLCGNNTYSETIFFIQCCIPEKIREYHTGSAFTKHYYLCRVLFVLNCKHGHTHVSFIQMKKNILPCIKFVYSKHVCRLFIPWIYFSGKCLWYEQLV